jgi:DNA repair protein RecN (Recombination protein N)
LALDEDESNACVQVGIACDALQRQAPIEPVFKGLTDLLRSSQAQLEDAVHSLRAYLRKTEPDPLRLQALDDRIALWVSLQAQP